MHSPEPQQRKGTVHKSEQESVEQLNLYLDSLRKMLRSDGPCGQRVFGTSSNTKHVLMRRSKTGMHVIPERVQCALKGLSYAHAIARKARLYGDERVNVRAGKGVAWAQKVIAQACNVGHGHTRQSKALCADILAKPTLGEADSDEPDFHGRIKECNLVSAPQDREDCIMDAYNRLPPKVAMSPPTSVKSMRSSSRSTAPDRWAYPVKPIKRTPKVQPPLRMESV